MTGLLPSLYALSVKDFVLFSKGVYRIRCFFIALMARAADSRLRGHGHSLTTVLILYKNLFIFVGFPSHAVYFILAKL